MNDDDPERPDRDRQVLEYATPETAENKAAERCFWLGHLAWAVLIVGIWVAWLTGDPDLFLKAAGVWLIMSVAAIVYGHIAIHRAKIIGVPLRRDTIVGLSMGWAAMVAVVMVAWLMMQCGMPTRPAPTAPTAPTASVSATD